MLIIECAYLHIVGIIVTGFPVRDCPHSRLSIPKFLAERSKLGLGMATTVWIMKGHVQEERPRIRDTYPCKMHGSM